MLIHKETTEEIWVVYRKIICKLTIMNIQINKYTVISKRKKCECL